MKYPQPDNRVVLYKTPPEMKSASCSALVLHEPKASRKTSSAPQSVDHATRVAHEHHAKSRSEYSQSSSGSSSRRSRTTSTDGHRSERQKRPRSRHSSRRPDIRPQHPPPPPQFQGPRAPGQPPPGPTSAPRHPQEQSPLPRPGPPYGYCIPPPHMDQRVLPQPLYCPPPTYFPQTPVYPPQTEISNFEREKLSVMEKLAETTGELALQMERYNDNADAMRYQTLMYYHRYPLLPTFNI
ncbi:hypothetical protein BPAE_0284g00040 [Botrytis paeoniae]|uniref:Uncharacterized protein n=1 Tax=Botrytis paeoniae TaxID=278948 RepID=A0A4Z1FG24_9HELO|nr:hypothetical protein BPAE_0284g00040 [Botrytis paeoniae]